MDENGTVNVYPGSYIEVAVDRTVVGIGGLYQFGLYFGVGKDNITLRGVDAGGAPITSYGSVEASVGLNATNNFGPSRMWVEADGITVTGLGVAQTGDAGYNKSVEVVGDDFTFKCSRHHFGTVVVALSRRLPLRQYQQHFVDPELPHRRQPL
ncbi:MAG: hypothetical protein IPK53_04195 [bacterium]|nr:hypothetical protein [bacterium]